MQLNLSAITKGKNNNKNDGPPPDSTSSNVGEGDDEMGDRGDDGNGIDDDDSLYDVERQISPRAAPREDGDVKLAFLGTGASSFEMLGETQREQEFDTLLKALRRHKDQQEVLLKEEKKNQQQTSSSSAVGGGVGTDSFADPNVTPTTAASPAGGSFAGASPQPFHNSSIAGMSPQPASQQNNGGGQDLIYTVYFMGSSGSGKSTFKQCCTQTALLKNLPEVKSSVQSSNSLFYFTSSKKDRLELQTVDCGPQHNSRCAVAPQLFQSDSMYLIHMSLAGIKQLGKKSFLSSEHRILFHDNDKDMIRAHIASIVAATPPTSGSTIAVIGTHMDLLSDTARSSVEKVLQMLHDFLSEEVRSVMQVGAANLRIAGCFAVNCTNHDCVSENRGGPKNIKGLWEFLCDLCVKDARIKNAALAKKWGGGFLGKSAAVNNGGSGSIPPNVSLPSVFSPSPANPGGLVSGNSSVALSSNNFTADSSEAGSAYGGGDTRGASPSSVSGKACGRGKTDQAMRALLIGMIRKAKSELGVVLTKEHVVAQVAFSQGNSSKSLLKSVMSQLQLQNEIHLFSHQPEAMGRQRHLLLTPHYICRAAYFVHNFALTNGYPKQERQRVLPGLNIEECERADPRKYAAKGVILPKLMVALSRCITAQKDVGKRAELFAMTLILSDVCVQLLEPSPDSMDLDSLDVGMQPPSGLLYVAPSLVYERSRGDATPRLLQHAISEKLFCSHQVLRLHPCPAAFFPQLVCRLGNYLTSTRCITANGVWLTSNSKLQARGWIQLNPRTSVTSASSSAARRAENDLHSELGESSFSIVCCSASSAQAAMCFAIELLTEIRKLISCKYSGCLHVVGDPPASFYAGSTDGDTSHSPLASPLRRVNQATIHEKVDAMDAFYYKEMR